MNKLQKISQNQVLNREHLISSVEELKSLK